MVERTLLVINRSSGTGHGADIASRLRSTLAETLGPRMDLPVEVVSDHPQARACARKFLRASEAPAAVIAGGGGGTLRAVMEGICDGSAPGLLPGRERIRVSGLRMGSGNVVAKQFGVPLDPLEGVRGIAGNLQADRTSPCCVMRCQIALPPGAAEIRHAVTMCGLGQFGRVPGDLARWRRRLPRLRRFLARLWKLEALNDVEYALASLIRFGWCAIWPRACEAVEIRAQGRTQRMRLLTAVVLNLPIKGLPFDPGVRIEEAALSLHLLPFTGRFRSLWSVLAARRAASQAQTIRLGPEDGVEIRFLDRDSVEFFLDEDPEQAHGRLTIQVAGTLAFVPGPAYSWPPTNL